MKVHIEHKIKVEIESYKTIDKILKELVKNLNKVYKELKKYKDIEQAAKIYDKWREKRKEAFEKIKEILAEIELNC